MLCNDLSEPDTAWTLDQVIDESAALLSEVVDLSGLSVDVPRTYVRLTQDHCYPPDLQERSSGIVGGDTVFLESRPHGHGVDPRPGGGPAEPAPPLSRSGLAAACERRYSFQIEPNSVLVPERSESAMTVTEPAAG